MNLLYTKRPIEVRTGDYRRKWMEAEITSVSIAVVGSDDDGNAVYGLDFDVRFLEDGCIQHVPDAFGWSRNEWRYKEDSSTAEQKSEEAKKINKVFVIQTDDENFKEAIGQYLDKTRPYLQHY